MSRMGPEVTGNRTRLRFVLMFAIGVAVCLIIGLAGSWWYAPVGGWAAACATYVIWVWARVIGRFDAEMTRTHSTREDPGRGVREVLILAVAVASLGAVAVLLVHTRQAHGIEEAAGAVAAVLSVALSWALLHTLYAFRYARIYYAEPVGGIDFNTDDDPRFMDFAYLSFDLGMTFQVSDTNIRTTELRGVILRHSLLSYVFGTVVLASVVNLVAGLTF